MKPIKIVITQDALVIKEWKTMNEQKKEDIRNLLINPRLSYLFSNDFDRLQIEGSVEERYLFLFNLTSNYDVELI